MNTVIFQKIIKINKAPINLSYFGMKFYFCIISSSLSIASFADSQLKK